MSETLSPNMSLPIPGVGDTPGPDYAIDVNAALTILDQHNHTPGSGVLITPEAIDINTDLSMALNSLTNIKSLQLAVQTSLSTTLAIYAAPGGESPSINDLWFNDGNGTPVQLTKDGLVNATIASIPGESYSAGTFFWRQGLGSTTPANFDIGSITLRPNIAATTYGTTIQPHASIASAFTLTLPNNPSGLSGNSFLTMNASGAITAGPLVSGGLTTTNLSPTAGIVGTQIADGTITPQQLSVVPNIVVQEFTANGTWTCPAGVTRVMVEGAGGGGGGGSATAASSTGGGGGGGGAPILTCFQTVIPAVAYAVVVGSGGAGGAGGGGVGAAGTSGGSSTFGSGIQFPGGTGGEPGGAGGTRGGNSTQNLNSARGGAGGASSASGEPGGASGYAQGGPGGSSTGGGGGGGGGSAYGNGGGGGNGDGGGGNGGLAATNNSGGGGGGGSGIGPSAANSNAGGTGGSGRVRVMWVAFT